MTIVSFQESADRDDLGGWLTAADNLLGFHAESDSVAWCCDSEYPDPVWTVSKPVDREYRVSQWGGWYCRGEKSDNKTSTVWASVQCPIAGSTQLVVEVITDRLEINTIFLVLRTWRFLKM